MLTDIELDYLQRMVDVEFDFDSCGLVICLCIIMEILKKKQNMLMIVLKIASFRTEK
ncbi:hypothetical protein [Yersinia phage fHe-Yen9-03]|uniref:Uncharacterized protein n=1 Tax=Yersinia phage fHe-Yen9-03 TaxID=2052743 RepID=A0A2C9CZ20_9CAUD|nr:hypothetical protein [Yersinia phage fHe-Yen9-03]